MEYTMKVRTDDRLVMFIYALLQNGTPVAQIEKAVDLAKDIIQPGHTVELCNGPLAVVAQEAARIIGGSGCIKVANPNGYVCSGCGLVFQDWAKEKNEKCPNCGEPWKK